MEVAKYYVHKPTGRYYSSPVTDWAPSMDGWLTKTFISTYMSSTALPQKDNEKYPYMNKFNTATLFIPAKYQKLFRQYIFDEQQHPSAVAYLDVDRVKLFDMISSLHFLQLYQQEAQVSTHIQAKEPVTEWIMRHIFMSNKQKHSKTKTKTRIIESKHSYLPRPPVPKFSCDQNFERKKSNAYIL